MILSPEEIIAHHSICLKLIYSLLNTGQDQRNNYKLANWHPSSDICQIMYLMGGAATDVLVNLSVDT